MLGKASVRRVSAATRLKAIVGDHHVLTDPDVVLGFGTDWTRRWSRVPLAVVMPATVEEVSGVVVECGDLGLSIVTQGGNTGLVGGSVPGDATSVVLSTTRLQRLDSVDIEARQVTAGAGVTLGKLQDHAAAKGMAYGVDLAARDSATVGGTIATNAGGLRVVAHGDTRAQVLGIEAIFADGSTMSHLAGLPKDSAGYQLESLLVGSEGTLAIVTAARLRLVQPLPRSRITAMVGVATVADAVALLQQPGLLAAELIVGPAMDLVCRICQLPQPLAAGWPLYVLLETIGDPQLPVGSDAAVDRRVWAYRERQTEAVSTLGHVHKLDVGVPLRRLQECLDRLPSAVYPHQCFVFGHLAEGNLHVEVVGASPDDEAVDETVLGLVVELGGTVSAEHGIGRAKAKYLHLARDGGYVAAMRRIKQGLDPKNLLNPGVLLR